LREKDSSYEANVTGISANGIFTTTDLDPIKIGSSLLVMLKIPIN
jgi:hypothetical protein